MFWYRDLACVVKAMTVEACHILGRPVLPAIMSHRLGHHTRLLLLRAMLCEKADPARQ